MHHQGRQLFFQPNTVSWNLRSRACFTGTALACHAWEVWQCGWAVVSSLFGDYGNIFKIRIGGMRVSYYIPPGYVVKFFESRVTKVLNSSKESDPSNGKHTTNSCQ